METPQKLSREVVESASRETLIETFMKLQDLYYDSLELLLEVERRGRGIN